MQKVSYDPVREEWGIYGPGPRCKDSSLRGVRKDCVHISGLEVEGLHPRALMECALVCLRTRIRCKACRSCCSMDLLGTKRMLGRLTASQIASASLASFFCDFR